MPGAYCAKLHRYTTFAWFCIYEIHLQWNWKGLKPTLIFKLCENLLTVFEIMTSFDMFIWNYSPFLDFSTFIILFLDYMYYTVKCKKEGDRLIRPGRIGDISVTKSFLCIWNFFTAWYMIFSKMERTDVYLFSELFGNILSGMLYHSKVFWAFVSMK